MNSGNRRWRWLAALAVATLGWTAGNSMAGTPRYENIILTDDKAVEKDKRKYGPATPKIFLLAKLADVPTGAKVKAAWIAVKTKVAPPNYEIDATELDVGAFMNRVTFSLSKPKAGWPEGDYHVALSIDGKPSQKVTFGIAP